MTAFRRTEETEYDRVYNRGLDDEDKVIAFLAKTGQHSITVTDGQEDQFADVDLILDGVKTSIKCQHKGKGYGNLYMELATQRYSGCPQGPDSRSQLEAWAKQAGKNIGYLLNSTRRWFDAWYLTGEADQYLIWQVDTLRLYRKSAIQAHVAEHGFVKVLGLSSSVLNTQGGLNTICGYLNVSDVPYVKKWTLRDPKLVTFNPL